MFTSVHRQTEVMFGLFADREGRVDMSNNAQIEAERIAGQI